MFLLSVFFLISLTAASFILSSPRASYASLYSLNTTTASTVEIANASNHSTITGIDCAATGHCIGVSALPVGPVWAFHAKVSIHDAAAPATLGRWTKAANVLGPLDGPFLWKGTYYLISGSFVFTIDEETLAVQPASFSLAIPLGATGCFAPFAYPLGVCCTTGPTSSPTTMLACLSLDDGHVDYVHNVRVGTLSGTITLSSSCALMPANSFAPSMVGCLATDEGTGEMVLAIVTAETVAVATSLSVMSDFAISLPLLAVTGGAGGATDCALAVSGMDMVNRRGVDVWVNCSDLPVTGILGNDYSAAPGLNTYKSVPSFTE